MPMQRGRAATPPGEVAFKAANYKRKELTCTIDPKQL
jgi:hypothetical protein